MRHIFLICGSDIDPQKQKSIFKAGTNRPSLKAFAKSKPGSVNADKYAALAAKKQERVAQEIKILAQDQKLKVEKHKQETECFNLQIMNMNSVQAMFEEKHKREMKLLDLQIKSQEMDIEKKKKENK